MKKRDREPMSSDESEYEDGDQSVTQKSQVDAQTERSSKKRPRQSPAQLASVLGDTGLPDGISIVSTGHEEELAIQPIETSKDLIEQPELAQDELKLIPSRGYSMIINGASGTGKSTLLANYATNPHFFGKSEKRPQGWFDKIFLFSPTADGDDIQKALGIPKSHVCNDMDEAPQWLSLILKSQKEKLAGGGKAHKVSQYWFIFDDVIGETKFMKETTFLQCWYMVRHRNATTTCCTQHYKRLPKVCRQQASFIHFFAGNQQEVEQIVEDFAPPRYTKSEFRSLVTYATLQQYDFLTVCMKVGWVNRFRHNLGQILRLDRLVGYQKKDKKPGQKGTEDSGKKKDSGTSISVSQDNTSKKPKRISQTKFGDVNVQEAIETILRSYIQKYEWKNEQKASGLH